MKLVRLSILSLVALAACGGPTYVSNAPKGGTPGEIPRDGRGDPLWAKIPPPPPAAAPGPAMPGTAPVG